MLLSRFSLNRQIVYPFLFLILTVVWGRWWAQAQAAPGVTDCAAQTEIPEAECDALVTFFNSTGGINWTNQTGWASTNTPCSWYGVTCHSGRVYQLSLASNQLDGTIPDLSALTHLQFLFLSDNRLTGTIPDLSALTKLQYLYLKNNQLTGAIPDLSTLTNLQSLALEHNQLTGTIPDLSDLTVLQNLYLNNNQLSGSIPDLSALTNLQGLYLYDNHLSGVIPDLSALVNLQILFLYNNQLSGVIPDLSALSGLQFLYLYNNQLSGPIPDLSGLTNLQYLYLHNNQLSSTIPDLSALTKLQYIALRNNQLNGRVPNSVCQVLSSADLGYNMLEVDTADPCVDTAAPDWKKTQTVPPDNIKTAPGSSTSIRLTWDAIAYTEDVGSYHVWGRAQGDAAYSLLAMTTNKSITSVTVPDLQAHIVYEFFIRTFTPSHGSQQNDLMSEDSAVVTMEIYPIYLPVVIESAP